MIRKEWDKISNRDVFEEASRRVNDLLHEAYDKQNKLDDVIGDLNNVENAIDDLKDKL